MCDCCKKIIVQNEIGIPGPQGDPGTNGSTTDFISVENIILLETEIPYFFNYTAPSDGDYILQLELYTTFNGIYGNDLTSQLVKNNIIETNINRNHRIVLNETKDPFEITFTHNCKITGVSIGDDIGFRLMASSSNVVINNGSITIIKTA